MFVLFLAEPGLGIASSLFSCWPEQRLSGSSGRSSWKETWQEAEGPPGYSRSPQHRKKEMKALSRGEHTELLTPPAQV